MLILSFISFSAITALCSILHGKGDGEDLVGQFWEGKGFIIAVHMILAISISSIFAPVAVLTYWWYFRIGDQARAEILYLLGLRDKEDIIRQYPMYIGYAVYFAIHRCKTRRQQEYVSAWVISALLAIPVILVEYLTKQ